MPVAALRLLSPCVTGMSARRRALAGAALVLALSLLAACGPNPAGSGGLVGHMAGTSDVAGQTGDPDVGGACSR